MKTKTETRKGSIIRVRTDATGWRRVFVEHPAKIRFVCEVNDANEPIGKAWLYADAAANQPAEDIAWDFLYRQIHPEITPVFP